MYRQVCDIFEKSAINSFAIIMDEQQRQQQLQTQIVIFFLFLGLVQLLLGIDSSFFYFLC